MCHPVSEDLDQSGAIQEPIGMLGRHGGCTGRIAQNSARNRVRAFQRSQYVAGIEGISRSTGVDDSDLERRDPSRPAVSIDSASSGTECRRNVLDAELEHGLCRSTQLSSAEGNSELGSAGQGHVDEGKGFTDRFGRTHGGMPREIDRSPHSRLPRGSKSFENGFPWFRLDEGVSRHVEVAYTLDRLLDTLCIEVPVCAARTDEGSLSVRGHGYHTNAGWSFSVLLYIAGVDSHFDHLFEDGLALRIASHSADDAGRYSKSHQGGRGVESRSAESPYGRAGRIVSARFGERMQV